MKKLQKVQSGDHQAAESGVSLAKNLKLRGTRRVEQYILMELELEIW
jgi:hypothetical protein